MATADSLTPRRRRWLLARGLLRALATAVLMVVLYYTLPLGSLSDVSLVAELSVGVALLVGVIIWQVGAIERAKYPAIRATQALAVTTPLFLLFFASSYYILSADDTATFTESLSRSDALYLTVTIFATVGFGDISAQTETARLFVTAQMLLDLVVLGLGIQVILGAVKRGKAKPGRCPTTERRRFHTMRVIRHARDRRWDEPVPASRHIRCGSAQSKEARPCPSRRLRTTATPASRNRRSGWATGFIMFAGVMMIVAGGFQSLAGWRRCSRTTSTSPRPTTCSSSTPPPGAGSTC